MTATQILVINQYFKPFQSERDGVLFMKISTHWFFHNLPYLMGLNCKVMLKEQNSFSQDLCLIQWIKIDCAHLWIVLVTLFSLYCLVYIPHLIYCRQYNLTFKTGLFVFPQLFGTLFCSPIDLSTGPHLFFMEDFHLYGPRLPWYKSACRIHFCLQLFPNLLIFVPSENITSNDSWFLSCHRREYETTLS